MSQECVAGCGEHPCGIGEYPQMCSRHASQAVVSAKMTASVRATKAVIIDGLSPPSYAAEIHGITEERHAEPEASVSEHRQAVWTVEDVQHVAEEEGIPLEGGGYSFSGLLTRPDGMSRAQVVAMLWTLVSMPDDHGAIK